MSFWKHLDNILYVKKKIDINVDDLTDYNAFSVNRWASMHSPETAWIINETYNKLWDIFETNEERYKFQMALIPKLRRKRINYIKKKKKAKTKDPIDDREQLKLLARSLELSQREVKLLIEHEESL